MTKVQTSIKKVSDRGCTAISVHPSGESVFVGTTQGDIMVYDAECTDSKSSKSAHAADVADLLICADGDTLVSLGATDGKVYKFGVSRDGSDIDDRTGLTIFDNAAQTASFSSDKEFVYCAGNKTELVRITVANPRSHTNLPAPTSEIKHISVSPDNKYLAVSQFDGNITMYNTSSLNIMWSKPLLPALPTPATSLARVSWCPSGDFLAVPHTGGVRFYSIHGSLVSTLVGKTFAECSAVAFAPNGYYIAAADVSGKIALWESDSGKLIEEIVIPGSVSGLTWSPTLSQLYVASRDGNITLLSVIAAMETPWTGVDVKAEDYYSKSLLAAATKLVAPGTPPRKHTYGNSGTPKRSEGTPNSRSTPRPRKSKWVEDSENEDEEEEVVNKRKRVAVAENNDNQKSTVTSGVAGIKSKGSSRIEFSKTKDRKERLSSMYVDDDDNSNDEYENVNSVDNEDDNNEGEENASTGISVDPVMIENMVRESINTHISASKMEPFMPNRTPIGPQRYLAWNEIGSVLSTQGDSHNTLMVHLNEGNKRFSLPDFHLYNLAALSSHGIALASPRIRARKSRGDAISVNRPSTVVFQRVGVASQPGDWSVQLPESESAECIAIGRNFVAVGTTQQSLRIFTVSGIEKIVLSIPGPVISMTGRNNTLAVVYQAHTQSTMEQSGLRVQLWELDTSTRLLSDAPLALSPRSTLQWIGITDADVFLTMDSEMVFRGLFSHLGFAWVHILHAKEIKSLVDERGMGIWPIGCRFGQLLYIPLFNKQKYPLVGAERPTHKAHAVTMPLLSMSDETPTKTAVAVECALRERLFYEEMQYSRISVAPMDPARAKIHDVAFMALAMNSVQEGNMVRALDAAAFIHEVDNLKMCIDKINSLPGTQQLVGNLALLLKSRLIKAQGQQGQQQTASLLVQATNKPRNTPSVSSHLVSNATQVIAVDDPFTSVDSKPKMAHAIPKSNMSKPADDTAEPAGQERVKSDAAKKAKSPVSLNPFAK